MARSNARYQADELYRLALEQWQKNNLDQAITYLEHAIQLLPNYAEYFAVRGFLHYQNGDRERAQINFDEALYLNPHEMLAHYAQGMMAYEQRHWEQALEHFHQAYVTAPEKPEIHYYFGVLNHRLGQNELALRWMYQAQIGFHQQDDKRHRDAGKWVKSLAGILEVPVPALPSG